MKVRLLLALAAALTLYAAAWLYAQPAADPLVEGLRLVEVASVADAAEQLYGQRIYMSHDMGLSPRPSSQGPRSLCC